MVRKLLPVVFLLIASPLCAFRARPLSDLAFDNRVGGAYISIASDGTDFLVVWHLYPSQFYGQLISRGGTRGPAFLIGSGSSSGHPSVVWAGSKYLVSRPESRGVIVTAVSRSGAILESSGPLLTQGWLDTKLTVGRTNILLTGAQEYCCFSAVEGQMLDFDGRPQRSPFSIAIQGVSYSVTSTSYGFAIGAAGRKETMVARVGADGALLGTTRLEGPYVGHTDTYYSYAISLGSDGSDVMVFFGASQLQSPASLKTAIVAADGTTKRAATAILEDPADRGLMPVASLWTGAEYVTLLNTARGPTTPPFDYDAALLHTTRDGHRIGTTPVGIAGTSFEAIAWNGREYAVTSGQFAEITPTGVAGGETVVPLGDVVNAQTAVTVAASDSRYLAAWIERVDGESVVRASRLDAEGNYLDGRGIVLAKIDIFESQIRVGNLPYPTVAVDSDGRDWLVVWANGSVLGARVTNDGVLLDQQPIKLGSGLQAAVRWGTDAYVVVSTGYGQLRAYRVMRDGIAVPSLSLNSQAGSIRFQSPALAFDGSRFLALATSVFSWCAGGIQPTPCGNTNSVIALKIDVNGGALDLAPTVVATGDLPAVASDGQRYAVAWRNADGVSAAVVPVGSPLSSLTPTVQRSKTTHPALTFDGLDFVLGLESATGPARLQIVRLTAGGTQKSFVEIEAEFSESDRGISFTSRPSMPVLLSFGQQLDASHGIQRAAALRLSEVTGTLIAPMAPSLISATRLGVETVGVSWRRVEEALGVAVELRLPDGTYRQVGNAGGGSTSAVVNTAGLQGMVVRLRAWNAAGMSDASADAFIGGRVRAVRR